MVYEILRETQKTGYNYIKMETLSRNRKRDELGIERQIVLGFGTRRKERVARNLLPKNMGIDMRL